MSFNELASGSEVLAPFQCPFDLGWHSAANRGCLLFICLAEGRKEGSTLNKLIRPRDEMKFEEADLLHCSHLNRKDAEKRVTLKS